ncbi:uncharacterized protein LOC133532722 isoform X3 [Cydia pomonella]|uniref:uncharacterized protein LOC133532722 isoform X3 n=1 Tax=Cydia pomonella TaxID=82600 RepID=UPI002ADE903D|nr:uncharacterized protein LOC133532722 isoform X3 [Cydia pomonella]
MATRPYQGYPYTNPHVIDAPSIDAATASRWNNLPRRPLQPPQPRDEVNRVSKPISNKKHPDAELDPVIYIDVPDEVGSDVAGPASSRNRKSESDSEPDPVIYIDVPDEAGSDVAGPASSRNRKSESDSEPDPVIYIEVPDGEGSDVAGPARTEPEPEYVQLHAGDDILRPVREPPDRPAEAVRHGHGLRRRIVAADAAQLFGSPRAIRVIRLRRLYLQLHPRIYVKRGLNLRPR